MPQIWNNVIVGSTQATKVLVGTTLVWEEHTPDTFTEDFKEFF